MAALYTAQVCMLSMAAHAHRSSAPTTSRLQGASFPVSMAALVPAAADAPAVQGGGAAALQEKPWRSCRPGRIPWKEANVNEVARGIMRELPLTVHHMLQKKEWKGGRIVRLDSVLCRPCAADVAANYHYLKPILAFSPDRVPSGYFLTDVMMRLDQMFAGNLLLDPQNQLSKLDLAAEEGVKLKKLVGATRTLWRSSETGNHPHVTELKSLLTPSPRKVHGWMMQVLFPIIALIGLVLVRVCVHVFFGGMVTYFRLVPKTMAPKNAMAHPCR